VTGIESLAPEIDAKRVELLKEIVPELMRFAALYSPNDQGAPTHLEYTEDAASALGIRVLPLEVRAPSDYGSVFAPLAAKPIGGLTDVHRPADVGQRRRRRIRAWAWRGRAE
jgi:putative ABC transport system substrate-binding protein